MKYEEEDSMQHLGVENLCQSIKHLRQWFKRQKWRPHLSFLRLTILASTGSTSSDGKTMKFTEIKLRICV